jgi:hypothetical protein
MREREGQGEKETVRENGGSREMVYIDKLWEA